MDIRGARIVLVGTALALGGCFAGTEEMNPHNTGDIIPGTGATGDETGLCLEGRSEVAFERRDQSFAFRFHLDSGAVLRLEVRGSPDLDTLLYLFAPDDAGGLQKLPAVMDDDSGDGDLSRIEGWTAARAGTHVAVLTTRDGLGTGVATLEVTVDGVPGCRVPRVPDDGPEEAGVPSDVPKSEVGIDVPADPSAEFLDPGQSDDAGPQPRDEAGDPEELVDPGRDDSAGTDAPVSPDEAEGSDTPDDADDPDEAIDSGVRDEAIDAVVPDEAIDAVVPDEATDAVVPDEAIDADVPDEAPEVGDPDVLAETDDLDPCAPGHCDDGNPCTADTCDLATGLCTHQDRWDTTCCETPGGGCGPCEVPFCNVAAGWYQCRPVADANDEDPCTIDTCDPVTSLPVHTPRDCGDGNPCTVDVCRPDGACLHAPVACDCSRCETCVCSGATGAVYCDPVPIDDLNDCTIDVCDPATGVVSHLPKTCAPSDPCHLTDCGADGECEDRPVVCDDLNPCTTDECDLATGACMFHPVHCDDGNSCTSDACNPATGECEFRVLDCGGTFCLPVECSPSTGQCLQAPRNCDDGDPCTDDRCDEVLQQCQHVSRNSDDGNACTDDHCDPATGMAVHKLRDCGDGNLCTDDLCNPITGACENRPIPEMSCNCVGPVYCVPETGVQWCYSGNYCAKEINDPATGSCRLEAVDCSDDDPCTTDSCDPTTGACLRLPCPEGTACVGGSCVPAS